MRKMSTLTTLFLMLAAGGATASTVTVDAVGQGWYRASGEHVQGNPNIFIGLTRSQTHHSFLRFDLAGITDSVSAADVVFVAGNGTQLASGAGELSLFAVTTALAELGIDSPVGSAAGQAIHGDLGSGTVLGSVGFTNVAGAGMPELVVPFGLDGLLALNDAIGGGFAVGGALTAAPDGAFGLWFGSTAVPAAQLRLTAGPAPELPSPIPLPASAALLIAALAGLGLAARHRAPRPS